MPLKVVIAPDKFRGSLSAPEAAAAMARGVGRACNQALVDLVPMADGGEGTVEALVAATRGSIHRVAVSGPLGDPVEARIGLFGDDSTAVIEMADASGLALIPPDRRDPSQTTTRGTGELLLQAAELGVRRIILGIGGSATNDGGAGLAQALGYRLLDERGREIGPGGASLEELDRIEIERTPRALDGNVIEVACDVDNPLCGPRGASAVYGPQKGADPAMVARLDANLDHYARIIKRDLGTSVSNMPGAGAAGGLGAGLVVFAGGRLRRGVELVVEAVRLAERLAGADLCLTGEGSLDASSAFGKTVVGVAKVAESFGVPTIALAGTIGDGARAVLSQGIAAYFSLCPGPLALDRATAEAADLLEQAAEQVLRAFLVGRPKERHG